MKEKNEKDRAEIPVAGGVIVPIITPVDEEEQVDEKALRSLIRRCLASGVNGIFAGGSAGMGPLLVESQWRRLMEIARSEVDSDRTLLGGVIATSTGRALEQIRILDQLGFENMVVTPTFYITISQAEMMAHFIACRQATHMRMAIYNIPSCTGATIPLKVIEEMAEQGLIHLVKDSSGDREYFSRLLGICRENAIALLQGHEPDIEWALAKGAAGAVPVCANFEPGTFVDAFRVARSGDMQALAAAQRRISLVRDILVNRPNWISGIMYSMKLLGIGCGRPLKPLQELSPEEKTAINKLSGVQKSKIIYDRPSSQSDRSMLRDEVG